MLRRWRELSACCWTNLYSLRLTLYSLHSSSHIFHLAHHLRHPLCAVVNCLLMKVPEDVLDYVVVHELCHRLEMNHSPRFWKEVENIFPDYRVREKWLRENGKFLIRQVHG